MMDSHFHLIVQTQRANLSEFMRRFNICYTGWFNYHHRTCGHLYQGRYKALLVDADNYLLELSRYVHLNPVRGVGMKKLDPEKRWHQLRKHRWSSLLGYIDKRQTAGFVSYTMILQMIGNRRSYQRFLKDGLRYGIEDPHVDLQHQTILGDDDFLARVKGKHLEQKSLREQPTYRGLVTKVIPPDILMRRVADALSVRVESFSIRMGNGVNRGIIAELLYRYSALSQQEIGNLLGTIDYTAVSMLRHRFKMRMAKDKAIREKFDRAEKSLRVM
jgi:hypothetical protein